MHPTDISFCVAQGLVLRGEAYGPKDGFPIILLHGGGQTRWSWGETARALGQTGLRACAIDLRGHGQSDWSQGGAYLPENFAHDVGEIARSFNRPVALIGASLGGIAALLACGENPSFECAGLVIVDIAPKLNREGTERVRDFMQSTIDGFPSLGQAAQAIAEYSKKPPRLGREEGLLKNLRLDPDGKYRWRWDPAFVEDRGDEPVWHSDAFEKRLTAAAHRIQAPMLVVRGGKSDVLTKDTMEWLQKVLPRARQAEIGGAGHMIASDDNARFNAAILPFVTEVAGRSGSLD